MNYSVDNKETERLIIRPTILEDCQIFSKWEKTKDVSDFFSIPNDQDYSTVVKEFIVNNEDETIELYTILTKENLKPVGRIHLGSISRKLDSLEIYRIYIGDKTLRNLGYGREALTWTLDRAFKSDNFHRVYLDYYTGNDNAAHLYGSLGFKHVGLARGACKKNGDYYDVNIMDILRDDYLK
ncbi:MAG: GNAT family N-acetyltransferase [Peptostreptococcaceae bacterium]|nr:GNAT family N-acetyltransferase [Peptostreptococcaceae bacterium]